MGNCKCVIVTVVKNEILSTILKVFGKTRSAIEPRSSEPLANTLPTRLTITTINPRSQCLGQGKKNIIFCVTTKSLKTVQGNFCRKFNFNNYPQKSQIYRWVHKFQATGSLNNLNKKSENLVISAHVLLKNN